MPERVTRSPGPERAHGRSSFSQRRRIAKICDNPLPASPEPNLKDGSAIKALEISLASADDNIRRSTAAPTADPAISASGHGALAGTR
jgi:hypothetical protein